MHHWWHSGKPWIWLTAAAVSLSIIAVLGLLLLISWHGLSHFWPHPVYQWKVLNENNQPTTVIGELKQHQSISQQYLKESGANLPAGPTDTFERILVKTGNREFVSLDFRWIPTDKIIKKTMPLDVAHIERQSNGDFYGYPLAVLQSGQRLTTDHLHGTLKQSIQRAQTLKNEQSHIERYKIGAINFKLEQLRLEESKAKLNQNWNASFQQTITQQRTALEQQYQEHVQHLQKLKQQAARDTLIVKDMRGEEVKLPINTVIDIIWPNQMTLTKKISHFAYQLLRFVREQPREANTEGGVFPAIFGTVLMVLLMSVIVTPLGVIAAIYMHEYAKKNRLTRLIRIAVINLAGVPSIVYGVFGLGFFVYFLGGSLDQLFYPEALPTPTFGTPGILWSSLTLAILTVPVVIVSTEEGLSRIPTSLRHGSLALGATHAETLTRIILPMASPAIMTGLILAVARAAGEVAPLMLVGVVKVAPNLPIDGNFPYLHLERKFMHLGFQIYDVGFQSPNIEAAQPLVYAISLLLVLVIVGLNLTAISIRNQLREKYRTLDH